MARMQWLRLYTEIIDDPKLRDFSGDEFRCWIYLLCLARESDRPGFVRGDAADLAWRMRRPLDEVQAMLEKAQARGMVRPAPDGLDVVHFLERQYDHPSDAPEAVRSRVRRHRGNGGATTGNDHVTTGPEKRNDRVTTCNDTDTDTDADTEEKREEEMRGEEAPDEATDEGGKKPDGEAPPAAPDGRAGPGKTRAEHKQDGRAGAVAPAEEAVLAELAAVPGYPADPERDLALVRALAAEFPDLDLAAEARRWRTYKLDRPLAPRANPRLQFRNWCEVAARRARDSPAPRGRGGGPGEGGPGRPAARKYADLYLS